MSAERILLTNFPMVEKIFIDELNKNKNFDEAFNNAIIASSWYTKKIRQYCNEEKNNE